MSILHWHKQTISFHGSVRTCGALMLAVTLLGVSAAGCNPASTTSTAKLSDVPGSVGNDGTDPSENELTQSGARVRTDRAVYPKPPLPQLPRAGGKYFDAVFGSEIMRATDEADGPKPGLGTYYSHWPTFNSNNTRLLIRKGESGDAILKEFDPVTFTIKRGSKVLPNSIPEGGGPSWESSIWSNIDPNVIYTFPSYFDGGMKLFSFNVLTGRFKLIKDFGSTPGGKDFLKQMYMSEDDNIFCWLQQRSGENNGEPVGYIVYKRSTNQVLYQNRASFYAGGINEVHVDKTGKWLHIVVPTKQADGTGTRFLNLETGRFQALKAEVDHPPGHGDLGRETIMGFDNYENGVSIRNLNNVFVHYMALVFTTSAGVTDWTNDFHGTMLADDESWVTIGTFDEPSITLPDSGVFEDEIIQISTDGKQRLRRICHTRSSIDNKTNTTGYWAMPKPTISKDGRYIAFTSNWEKSGRYDLFIVKVEPPEPMRRESSPTPEQRPRRVGTP